MTNESLASSFPASSKDVANLKQTAAEAVNDLGSTAATHAAKAKGQLQDLKGHLREEGGEQLAQAQVRVEDVIRSARDYAATRPLTCIGIALAVGVLFGLSRRGSCQS